MGERGFADVFGEVIADIRSKLIDEGWFGRRAAPGAGLPGDPATGPGGASTLPGYPSFEEAWGTREPAAPAGAGDRDIGLDI